MARTTDNTIERRVRKRNELSRFMDSHAADYAIQVNFCVKGSPDHICVGLPHDKAEAIHNLVIQFLAES